MSIHARKKLNELNESRYLLDELKKTSDPKVYDKFIDIFNSAVGESRPDRVLFLDIDGVLNTGNGIGQPTFFDPTAVHWLRSILERTGAEIVMSSTWRSRYKDKLDAWEFYKVAGITDRHIHEDFKTKHLHHDLKPSRAQRGHEIKEWLNRHPEVTSYVILDDDSDMLPEQMNNFVKVDGYYGLGFIEHNRAVSILENGSLSLIDDKETVPSAGEYHQFLYNNAELLAGIKPTSYGEQVILNEVNRLIKVKGYYEED